MAQFQENFLEVIVGIHFPTPAISSVSPSGGTPLGGAAVTISGVGFGDTTSVTFGGIAGTITSITDTSIHVTSPGHFAGTVDVVVVTPHYSLTASGAFTYASSGGNITSISPTSGSAFGGYSITINGSGFTGQTGANIAGNAIGFFTVVNDGKITGTVPGHAVGGPFDVHVTGPHGTYTKAGAFTYTF